MPYATVIYIEKQNIVTSIDNWFAVWAPSFCPPPTHKHQHQHPILSYAVTPGLTVKSCDPKHDSLYDNEMWMLKRTLQYHRFRNCVVI